MRQGGQHAGAVAGVRLAPAGAAVIHAAQQLRRVHHNLVTAHALDVRDEPHAARVLFELRVVQALRWRQMEELGKVVHGEVSHRAIC